ncbi:hypothetical protein MBM_00864 [Drepanopeziza brunnea f. sp. 'multigermtubi' MB_m1]|uniref:Uncharacterized protein n=1 Tax=Marssonina brunnea f. sp. multigermtubi (strain MB_m1) TaxID=1072389 RepID=K1X9J1_MARBU|nr:uncharacterized protein MBM_00864 [Drepanopeziza brunnea f. sp. 'multigermtubi' MB_m1]EKD21751.1 hypothetical protein MBM_00864 [Drepanopeziza brunnea f. sp. 'multigermtubi' MB_m1]
MNNDLAAEAKQASSWIQICDLPSNSQMAPMQSSRLLASVSSNLSPLGPRFLCVFFTNQHSGRRMILVLHVFMNPADPFLDPKPPAGIPFFTGVRDRKRSKDRPGLSRGMPGSSPADLCEMDAAVQFRMSALRYSTACESLSLLWHCWSIVGNYSTWWTVVDLSSSVGHPDSYWFSPTEFFFNANFDLLDPSILLGYNILLNG